MAGPFFSIFWIFHSVKFMCTVGLGKNWASPVLPHHRTYLNILFG